MSIDASRGRGTGPSKTYFPSSKAGLLAGLGIVALALLITAAQAAVVWPAGASATFLILVVLVAFVPRRLTPKGTALRAPVSQRQSGWIYMSGLLFGIICITITLNTGEAWWSLSAGLALAAGTAVWMVAIAIKPKPSKATGE